MCERERETERDNLVRMEPHADERSNVPLRDPQVFPKLFKGRRVQGSGGRVQGGSA